MLISLRVLLTLDRISPSNLSPPDTEANSLSCNCRSCDTRFEVSLVLLIISSIHVHSGGRTLSPHSICQATLPALVPFALSVVNDLLLNRHAAGHHGEFFVLKFMDFETGFGIVRSGRAHNPLHLRPEGYSRKRLGKRSKHPQA